MNRYEKNVSITDQCLILSKQTVAQILISYFKVQANSQQYENIIINIHHVALATVYACAKSNKHPLVLYDFLCSFFFIFS